jgi:uracil-DNA glycosylase
MSGHSEAIIRHQSALKACRRCPEMIGPVVTGVPVASKVLLIGQAPGDKEGRLGRPFAWTAGKTLFKWFQEIGLDESRFRRLVYMAAVCRCFPGKNPKGGDRVPSRTEIDNCMDWLEAEIKLLQPRLVLPVGKLAIAQLMPVDKLAAVIGKTHRIDYKGVTLDVIPLPHPSGASTWHRTEPGMSLLRQALDRIGVHPAWQEQCATK